MKLYSLFVLPIVLLTSVSACCKQKQERSVNKERHAGKGAKLTPESSKEASGEADNGEEPLELSGNGEPVLLLDSGKGGGAPQAEGTADNSRCFVCHLNYQQEELASVHARAGIGCVKCHGDCDAHIADESWASGGKGTPPGIMYPREKINPSCLKCHPEAQSHANDYKGKYCTDCHGDHRLPERKCKWKKS